jgi:hypothetical protein
MVLFGLFLIISRIKVEKHSRDSGLPRKGSGSCSRWIRCCGLGGFVERADRGLVLLNDKGGAFRQVLPRVLHDVSSLSAIETNCQGIATLAV